MKPARIVQARTHMKLLISSDVDLIDALVAISLGFALSPEEIREVTHGWDVVLAQESVA